MKRALLQNRPFKSGLVVLSLVASLLTGCIHYNRFTYGEMPMIEGCFAVLPFTKLYDPASDDDFLSEYLKMSLIASGYRDTIGPQEIESFFRKAEMTIPRLIDLPQAQKFGQMLGADGLMYGSFTYYPLDDRQFNQQIDNEKVGLMVGVDINLLDIKGGAMVWVYSTRFFTTRDKYLQDLSKVSQDITRTLLASSHLGQTAQPKSCWREAAIVNSLKVGGGKELGSKTLEAAAVAALPAKPSEIKKALKKMPPLDPEAEAAAKRLLTGESLAFEGLFKQRSTLMDEMRIGAIDSAIRAMESLPANTRFTVVGHVDATANSQDDFWVSAQQAEKIRKTIVAKAPKLKGRISVSSMGGSQPLIPNINRKGREMNRRLEIKAALKK